jgi:hypothetical protein
MPKITSKTKTLTSTSIYPSPSKKGKKEDIQPDIPSTSATAPAPPKLSFPKPDLPVQTPLQKAQQYERHFQVLPPLTFSNDFIRESQVLRDYLVQPQNILEMFATKRATATETQFEIISKTHKISQEFLLYILQKLHRKVIVQTNQELMRRLRIGADWFNHFLPPNRPYGLLTERLFDTTTPSSKPALSFPFPTSAETTYMRKSPEWIANIIWPLLNTKPSCVSDTSSDEYVELISHMYQNQLRDFVLFDDGAYSGSQKALSIFSVVWNKLTSIDPNASFTIYIIIPYMTQTAIHTFYNNAHMFRCGLNEVEYNGSMHTIKWSNTQANRHVYIWTGGMDIPETYPTLYACVQESLKEQLPEKTSIAGPLTDHISNALLTRGAGLMILEHKVPDFMSLPTYIGILFETKLRKHYTTNPPYKKVKAPVDASKTFACAHIDGKNNVDDIDIEMEDAFQGGKHRSKEIIYQGVRYKVHVSKKQNEFILKNNRKIYIKNIKL